MVLAQTTFEKQHDAELRKRVLGHLYGRQLPALRRLNVQVSDGVITLRGEVQSFYQQQIVDQCCRFFASQAAIINEIRVARPGRAALGISTKPVRQG